MSFKSEFYTQNECSFKLFSTRNECIYLDERVEEDMETFVKPVLKTVRALQSAAKLDIKVKFFLTSTFYCSNSRKNALLLFPN